MNSKSSIVRPKLIFSSEKYKNVKKSFYNFNLEVPIYCSEKPDVGHNSELFFPSLSWFPPSIPIEVISEEISVNELERPLNIFSECKYDNYNIVIVTVCCWQYLLAAGMML